MDIQDQLLAVVLFLTAAVVAVPLFKRLGLGAVLGYLAAGVLVGPWGMGVTDTVEEIRAFSEFGVVFLLFLIGLELHPRKIWEMRGAVLGLGSAQILITAVCIALYTRFIGLAWPAAIVVGLALALSSTAIGLQMLSEKGEMTAPHGRTSFAILIMQDIAVVPMLAVIPLMADTQTEYGEAFGLSAVKAVTALIAVVLGARFVLPHVFRIAAETRAREIFTGAAILAVIGAAFLMESVHLSMALGAFIVGVVLSDSPYRHQIEADVDRFRALLLGLFFMSVGMTIDFGNLAAQPHIIVGHVAALLAIKAVLLFVLCRLAGNSAANAIRVAFLLPQSGEFGFVMFSVAAAAGVLAQGPFQHALMIIALTMAVTPLVNKLGDRLARRIERPQEDESGEKPDADIQNHVVIAGMGRFGRAVASLLQSHHVPYVALENRADRVQHCRTRGLNSYFGDAGDPAVLESAKIGRARMVVIAIDSPAVTGRLIDVIRDFNPGVQIHARARDLPEAVSLLEKGVDSAVPEALEGCLQLGRNVLLGTGVAEAQVEEALNNLRRNDYENLRDPTSESPFRETT